jgi:tetratricopeptide (TPR) repeat protein
MEDPAEHFFNEGLDFVKLGHYTEAVVSYDKAIAINPNYVTAKQNREIALKKQT